MQTLREAFEGNMRTKTLRLIRTTGEFIERLPIEEALEKYGHCIYYSAYSESFTEVSVWIRVHTTK
jgi:hypothetical protein